jgi:hypothetical protein
MVEGLTDLTVEVSISAFSFFFSLFAAKSENSLPRCLDCLQDIETADKFVTVNLL